MKLREKQSLFARKIALLELVAIEMGYDITNGHALRCEDCHVGAEHSLHKLKLAKDINLFKDLVNKADKSIDVIFLDWY